MWAQRLTACCQEACRHAQQGFGAKVERIHDDQAAHLHRLVSRNADKQGAISTETQPCTADGQDLKAVQAQSRQPCYGNADDVASS